jgi:hypothetical protein
MEGKLKGILRNNTAFTMNAHFRPFETTGSLKALFSGQCSTSTISFETSPIPISMRIPFSRTSQPVLIASIGGFHGKINPFTLGVKRASLDLDAAVKTDELEADMEGKMECESRVTAAGKVAGNLVARPSFEINLGTVDDDLECDTDIDRI